jgi:UDP-N-acetylmuramoyl-L-alanyl-D-glutamate--2,6-diaminopimelate ligase
VLGYTLNADLVSPPGVHLLRARAIGDTGSGVRFDLDVDGVTVTVRAGLVGSFNVSNLLAVIGALIALSVEPDAAAALAAHLVPPPGRMQPVGGKGEPLAIIDYAHSPDALEKVLLALRPTAAARGGRLVCLFGCGGDRDVGKRTLMGDVASRLADAVVITSDNPRSEDPQAIVDGVMAGAAANATAVVDRAEAIRQTIERADVGDVVVIAGKGHEPYQEIRGVRHPFSDIAQAVTALEARRAARGTGS